MKILVAITGASGSIYAQRLLLNLENSPKIDKISVVFSKNAIKIYESELKTTVKETKKIQIFEAQDFTAPFASGSGECDAMIICPCSAGSLGRIASGVSDSLITRAADVMLKERRPLILVLRETPYNLIHIKNMETLTLAGAIICPACPSFYSNPQNITQLVDTVVLRILDILKIPNNGFKWGKN
ncbi:MAG: UbiX family flavin prenyltransferase [Bacteroidales bacterium]|nr:UbiX family flavin prenyltransferase [Bacteroidales bacterium]